MFGVTVVRVDSGGTLNGVLLRAGLVDELHLLVHPTLVGGTSQKTFFNDLTSENG
ncbi:MAG: dihydrofolate reductase family protein, partial [Cyanobacteria bacterium J06656_5]